MNQRSERPSEDNHVEIGKVYRNSKDGFNYYMTEDGNWGLVTPHDGAQLAIAALKPYMVAPQPVQEDKWTVRLRRAAWGTLAVFGLTGTIAACMVLDAVNKANDFRDSAQQKWEQEIEPKVNEALTKWEEVKPAIDEAKDNLDELNDGYDNLKGKIDEAQKKLEDILNPFN